MSGIAGIYSRQSFPNPKVVESMLQKMAHRGLDARQVWADGKMALGSCLLRVTPESENEVPVSSDRDGRFKLVWDGRIDNREDILPCLPSNLNQAPDPIVFLHAYQLWGWECLKHLIGEFSFALWDLKEQLFFAGRDRVGLKPFHYTWDGQTFAFSSEIKPLFMALGEFPGFDDEMVFSFLAFRNFKSEDHSRTFFKKINRLAPSHCLILHHGKLTIQPYAEWDLSKNISYSDQNQYAEHFREIFKKALKARLRSKDSTAIMLSGGHDSSAIASYASIIKKENQTLYPNLMALNLYSDTPSSDERIYARDVAASAGIDLHSLFAKTTDFITGLSAFLNTVEAPMINTSRNLEPYSFLQDRGVRTVLTGEGGDQILDEFGLGADLLSRLKLGQFVAKSRSFSEEFADNPSDFMKESLLMVLPQGLLNFRRKLIGSVPPKWLNRYTIEKMGFQSRVLRNEAFPKFSSFSQAATYFEVTKPYAVMKLELDERAWSSYGIELRCPFYDSRIINFMLSLPWEYRSTGIRKLILKQAMKGITPERILARRDKADHTFQTDLALETLLRGQRKPEVICNRSGLMQNYVDFRQVLSLSNKYLAGQRDLRFELWFLITTDYMLKQFTQGVLYDRKEEQEKEIHTSSSH